MKRIKGGRDRVHFAPTAEEKEILKQQANAKGMTLSYYIIWRNWHDWL
jgi:hypothetical protein